MLELGFRRKKNRCDGVRLAATGSQNRRYGSLQAKGILTKKKRRRMTARLDEHIRGAINARVIISLSAPPFTGAEKTTARQSLWFHPKLAGNEGVG